MTKASLVLATIVLFTVAATDARAQELPGESGGCDQLCGTVYQNGVPTGYSCTTGGDRNRKNCVATVNDCTTDPCGGFAIRSSTGKLVAVGTCADKEKLIAGDQAVLAKVRTFPVATKSERASVQPARQG